MRRISIGIIGDAGVERDSEQYKLAFNLGKILVENGYRIINGGMSGIMEAACLGAKSALNYQEGIVIGILPGFDPQFSNPFVDVVIPTGLDNYRNAIIANSDAIVALGGGAGTLSEMAFAWTFKRLLIAYDIEGWSGKLAGTKIDQKKRIDWDGDQVFKVSNEFEVLKILADNLQYYQKRHKSIISNTKEENSSYDN
jgi:uncharacterized protein (TIGR00725 family)